MIASILSDIALIIAATAMLGGVLMARQIKVSTKYIEAEVRPNGGSSLKDQVTKIDRKVDVLVTRLDESDSDRAVIHEQITKIAAGMRLSLEHDDDRDIQGKRYG